jgi:K+-transporting ATPase ATPase C chain
MRAFIRQLAPATIALLVLTVLTGVIYPLLVTGAAQVAFHDKANGSIIRVDGTPVGSKLIGQQFADAKYFHPRPSAAGSGYDGTNSSGSNLGPTNPALLDAVATRVADYRTENGLAATQLVPVDAVTSSASGLDPDISLANARLQAPRVASARGLPVGTVLADISAHIDDRPLGILGDNGVNVLELNLALDRAG